MATAVREKGRNDLLTSWMLFKHGGREIHRVNIDDLKIEDIMPIKYTLAAGFKIADPDDIEVKPEIVL